MANVDFTCYGSVGFYDPAGAIQPCSAGSVNWTAFKYVDLSGYGGNTAVEVTGPDSFVDAMAGLGYAVSIVGCEIYFTDILKPAGPDIPVFVDPVIRVVKAGVEQCVNDAIDYASFDYVDLSFYGGGEVEVGSNSQLIAAFAAIGVTVTITGCVITLVGWLDQATEDIRAYSHARVTVQPRTGSPAVCLNGALNFANIDCVDLSLYGGPDKLEVQTETELLQAIDPYTTYDIYIDGCDVVFRFAKAAQPAIIVYAFEVIRLVDTDEGLTPICVNSAYSYNKFEFINLSAYGGQSSVRVASNADVIAAFAALGIEVQFSGCDILVKDCRASYPDVEVSEAISITIVDTDENITTCGVNGFLFQNFDAINLCHYDTNNVLADCTNVVVNTNTELVNVFAQLGIEVIVQGCNIKLLNYTGTPQDIEACKYPAIDVVDEQGGALCTNNAIPFDVIESINMSPYGGPASVSPVDSNADIIDAFADVGIDVVVNGCVIQFQECRVPAPDIVATTVAPVMEAEIEFIGGDEGAFEMTLGAYLLTGNNQKLALTNGDRINVRVPSRGLNVDLIVGGTPNVVGTGYTNDVGGKWANEFVNDLTAVQQLTAAALLAGTYVLTFRKKKWALETNLKYQTNGPSTATNLTWEYRAKDLSSNRTSPVSSVLMKKIVTLLDGFTAAAHLNGGSTWIEAYGNPSLNPVASITHTVAGVNYPVTFTSRGYINGVEFERHTGNYPETFGKKTVDIEVLRGNGWNSVSRGYLNDDSDFLVRVPCGTVGTGPGCLISPYGEHEEGSQPNTWDFSFQCLVELQFIGQGNPPPQNGAIIYDGVVTNVNFTTPALGVWDSDVITLTGLSLNTGHTLRCEAGEPLDPNNVAYLDMEIEVVAVY